MDTPTTTSADLSKLMHATWAEALTPAAPALKQAGDFLRAEIAAGRRYLPAPDRILRAFERPLDKVRVVIVGQDPYPTPGHPVGLSFSVAPDVRPIPRSLANIYQELSNDLGITPPAHGDLSAWADHGVMLLNRVLTVRPGNAGSHRKQGWEQVTDCAIQALAAAHAEGQPLAAILWGRDAATLKPLFGDIPTIESAHPSPLSAHRGFFGSKPFSRVNELLVHQGATPLDWSLPVDADIH